MRKVVRLTESDLHKIIKESVNMILEWHPKKQPKAKPVEKLSPRQQEIYNYLLDSVNEEGIDDEELRSSCFCAGVPCLLSTNLYAGGSIN